MALTDTFVKNIKPTAAATGDKHADGREFLQTKVDARSASYSEKWLRGMVKDLFPYLGSLPLASIKARPCWMS